MFKPYINALRWCSLTLVFLGLLLIPIFSVYQNFAAAHAYDLLAPADKALYNTVETVVGLVSTDPATSLQQVKGSTWSATIFGYQVNDPLVFFSLLFSSVPAAVLILPGILIPVLVTLMLGRVFCGWFCPAALLFELTANLRAWMQRQGVPTFNVVLSKNLPYWLLAMLICLTSFYGAGIVALVYPPAILARELYQLIALGSFSLGVVWLLGAMIFDLCVVPRGFCRYICPGGVVYRLLGRFRVLRVQRKRHACNDCARCNAVCDFALSPMQDQLGSACSNCGACISACPTQALNFTVASQQQPYQGAGLLGRAKAPNNVLEVVEP